MIAIRAGRAGSTGATGRKLRFQPTCAPPKEWGRRYMFAGLIPYPRARFARNRSRKRRTAPASHAKWCTIIWSPEPIRPIAV